MARSLTPATTILSAPPRPVSCCRLTLQTQSSASSTGVAREGIVLNQHSTAATRRPSSGRRTYATWRPIKRRVTAKEGFREFHAARRKIQGYEAMHMIRKGQARRLNGSDVRQQIQFINKLFEVAA